MTEGNPFTRAELDLIADALSTHADKVRSLQHKDSARVREIQALRAKAIKLARAMP